MTRTFDAIIIGAGISGAAIAYELSKRGYRTINVDRLRNQKVPFSDLKQRLSRSAKIRCQILISD